MFKKKTSAKQNKVFITSIKFNTTHFLANMLAVTKILSIPMSTARTLCKNPPDEWIDIVPNVELKSKNTLDEIITELDEYEIEIKTINK